MWIWVGVIGSLLLGLIFISSGWTKQVGSKEEPIAICANNATYCKSPAKIRCEEYSCEPLSIETDSVTSGNYEFIKWFLMPSFC